ncbi:MAG: DMT family transporter [Candidatus Nanopelagicales bacterium]|nr:DMT family transporter [Candidatus Nanopelagicales bacterium]
MFGALALVSSIMWGTADFGAGRLSTRLPVPAVVGGSQFFGLVLMIVVATATSEWSADLGYLPWGLLAGGLGVAGLMCFYAALASGPNGVVAPITSTGVLMPLLVGVAIGSWPTVTQWWGVVTIMVGLVLTGLPELRSGGSRTAVMLALLAAVFFGGSLTAIGQGSQVSVVMTMTSMRFLVVGGLIVVALRFRTVGGIRRTDLPALSAVGVLDVGANLTYGLSTTFGQLAVSAVLASLYPVVTMILAWWVLREKLRPIQYAGVLAVLVGVALSIGQ